MADPERPRVRARWGWSVALALSTGILIWGASALDTDAVGAALRRTNPLWLIPALLLNLSTIGLWAALWRLLLPRALRIPWRQMVGVSAVMAMMANTVPLMAGHATGTLLLARREGVGEGAAVSVLAQDQLLEGIAKLLLLAAIAAVAPLPSFLRRGGLGLAAGVLILLLVLLVLSAWARRHPEMVSVPPGNSSRAVPDGTLRHFPGSPGGWRGFLLFLRRASTNLVVLRQPGLFAGGLALALAMKAAEGLAILATARALGLEIPLWAPLPVLGAVSLAGMVPLAPGNLGVYEGAAFWAWRWVGVDPGSAAAAALLQHLAYLLPVVGCGWLLLGWRAARGQGGARVSPAGPGAEAAPPDSATGEASPAARTSASRRASP